MTRRGGFETRTAAEWSDEVEALQERIDELEKRDLDRYVQTEAEVEALERQLEGSAGLTRALYGEVEALRKERDDIFQSVVKMHALVNELVAERETLREERDGLMHQWVSPYTVGTFKAQIAELEAEVEALRQERDAWRRVAIVHGAEVQADNEYLLRRHEPLEAENNRLIARVGELGAEVEALRKERDEAIAHDRQPYPTAWAYEQACRTIEALRAKADLAGRAREMRRIGAYEDDPDWWEWDRRYDALQEQEGDGG